MQSIAILAPKFWLESPFAVICCANIVEERVQTGAACAFVGDWTASESFVEVLPFWKGFEQRAFCWKILMCVGCFRGEGFAVSRWLYFCFCVCLAWVVGFTWGAYLIFWTTIERFWWFLGKLPIFVVKSIWFRAGIFNEYRRRANVLDLFGVCSGCFGKFGGYVLPKLNGIMGFA